MGCCSHGIRASHSPPPPPGKRMEEILLQIPNAKVHLSGDPPVELGGGDFTVLSITEDGLALATVIRVGRDLRWPLTRDEPVVKLDRLHYLFTVRDGEAGFLNYGVAFSASDSRLASLDQLLKERACFSAALLADSSSSSSPTKACEVYWKDYAPNIEDYNGVLAKAIAQGSGELVKGIFRLSNAYTSQVQKGASLIQPQVEGGKNGVSVDSSRSRGGINKALRRVRKLSKMTEMITRTLLNGVLTVTENATTPLIRSRAGKTLFSTVPGEVLLASLDVVAKVMDAAEVAERRALVATSDAVSGAVSQRFGKNVGEAVDDVFATAGHTMGTAWNVFKIRKAINPKSYVASTIVKSAGRKNAS